ncbi:MAG: PH domain-containing protein [Chloroflexota bacterium]
MKAELTFRPEQRLGLVFHVVAIAVLAAAAGLGLWQAMGASVGPVFLMYLLPGLMAAAATPLLAYRAYALRTAVYTLEREGIRLRWGLRLEDIPMDAVKWVHRAAELRMALPLPRLRWPGSVVGVQRAAGLGEVEFMAGDARQLVLIGTPGRVYAISPANPAAFLNGFQRVTEMGSLSPLPARSLYPTVLLRRVWADRPARALLLGGLALSLLLLIWVSLAIPGRSQVSLRFLPDGMPGELIPSVRLLLPVLNAIFYLVDVLLGLFFFRRSDSQPLAYLLWGSGALSPVLFLVGTFFILQASSG